MRTYRRGRYRPRVRYAAEELEMTVAKKCEQCGRVDMRATWPNAEDAAKDPVFDRWTCPNCAWTEFDLVEAEAEPAVS